MVDVKKFLQPHCLEEMYPPRSRKASGEGRDGGDGDCMERAQEALYFDAAVSAAAAKKWKMKLDESN